MKRKRSQQRHHAARIYYKGPSYFRDVWLAKHGKILLCSCGGKLTWSPNDRVYFGPQGCIHVIALCRNEFEAKNKHETKPAFLFCELTEFGETLFHHRWVEQAILRNG